MNRFSMPLEIRIHLQDGKITQFAQQDAEVAQKILRLAQPARLFAGEAMLVGDQNAIVAIHVSKVVRVDFITDLHPDWPLPANIMEMQQITCQEFEQRLHSESARIKMHEGPPEMLFAKMELSNGEQILLQMRAQLPKRLPLDQSMLLHHIFSARGLYAKRRGDGYVVINTASIARLTLYPGLDTALPGFWQASCVAD